MKQKIVATLLLDKIKGGEERTVGDHVRIRG